MTKEEYRAGAEDVVYLAACMVNGEKPDAERVRGMDLEQLYRTANRHLLTSIVGYALEAAGVRDPAFVQAKSKAIRKIVLFDTERADVLAELEKAGIWHMPLKGCVLKEHYPQIGMRQMADNDILYDVSRSMDVRKIMEGLGFKTTVYVLNNYNHDHYDKEPVCNFEMHRALFTPAADDAVFEYYQNIRSRMIKDEGTGFRYHLSPEDFYVYMIAHEHKHYSGGGTGLRSLLDTYVVLRKVPLDMAYVAGEIEKLGMTDFEAANRSLALHLFEGKPLTEEEQEMLDYVLSSGTYGTMANSVRKQIREKGRWGYFLSRMTLSFDMMTRLYPVLGKVPLLYPFCWAHRIIHAFFFKHKVFMYQLKAVLTWKESS